MSVHTVLLKVCRAAVGAPLHSTLRVRESMMTKHSLSVFLSRYIMLYLLKRLNCCSCALNYACHSLFMPLINTLFNVQKVWCSFTPLWLEWNTDILYNRSWMVSHQYWSLRVTSLQQSFGKQCGFSFSSAELISECLLSLFTVLWARKWCQ